MHFALYHPWVYLRSGAERVLEAIMTRSRHDWTLYTHHYEPENTYPELVATKVVELTPRVEVRRSLGALAPAALTIGLAALPQHHDAMLISSEGFGDFMAFRSTIPTACYCHTPLKILHDPVARRNLDRRNPRQAAALKLLGPLFASVDRRAWRRYRHVFVNSGETARRVTSARLQPTGPLEVLHPGVDASRYPPGRTARPPLFLVAGRIMWQKRIDLAIDAFRLSGAASAGAQLVVAGTVDEKSKPYLAELRALAGALPVRFEPDCTDARMAELYAAATGVLFTPPNEDFGIVPLEAMSAGVPVVAADGGGAPDTVVHGVTGWLVAPEPQAFAEKMDQLLGGDFEEMRVAARRRALEFTWERFVGRIDEVMGALVSA